VTDSTSITTTGNSAGATAGGGVAGTATPSVDGRRVPPAPGGSAPGRRPTRRPARWIAAVAALALAAAAGWAAATRARGGDGGTTRTTIPTALADVARRDLAETKDLDGTLEYADVSAVTGKLMGTVTGLAAEGSVVRRGGKLYEVDGRPVRLLYGGRPAWRALRVGDEGADVLQLERNLRALGYTADHDVTVDDEFTAATREAVEDWQADKGMPEDGVVDLGEVVFEPGEVRIGAHGAAVGAPAQGEIMRVSSANRVVSIDLPTSDQGDVAKGDKVTVELPDGTETGGRITSVGRVAETPPSSDDPTADQGDPTIEVEVTLDDPKEAGSLDQAPVQVSIVTDTAENVLTVPVNALVSLVEGGYAVEVDDGGQRHLVGVETGMFADGRVEVTGDGLREGAKVVVPA
jgi:peptidoglycan hydrolase-like protein with peptidoglycan-binding domain